MRHALVVCFFCLCASRVHADKPLLVREHGDLSRLEITGCRTFTADSIRRALEANLELLPAARPLAPLTTFERTLQRLIEEGYRSAGFPDVRVSAAWDEQRSAVVVQIEEGARLRCGEVRVAGVEDRLADTLRRGMTERAVPSRGIAVRPVGTAAHYKEPDHESGEESDPVWQPGNPASFHPSLLRRVEQLAETALREAGWWRPSLVAAVVRNDASATADLVLHVRDPGVRAVVREIAVEGNERDTRESVLAYLDLREGVPYSGELEQSIQQRLYDSGRYRDTECRLEELVGQAGALRLLIRVWEYAASPPLDQPLDEVDQVLVKAAQWLSRLGQGEHDLVVRVDWNRDSDGPLRLGRREFASIRLRLIVSGRRGCLLDAELVPLDRPAPVRFAVVLESERMHWYSGLSGRVYGGTFREPIALQPTLRLKGEREIGPEGEQVSLTGHMKLNSGQQAASTSFQFDAAPIVFLDARRRHGGAASLDGDRLVLQGRWFRIVVDRTSGQLLECDLMNEETQAAVFTVRTGRRAFEAAWQEVCSMQAGNEHEPNTSGVLPAKALLTDELPEVLAFLGYDPFSGPSIGARFIARELQRLEERRTTNMEPKAPAFAIPFPNDGEDAGQRGFFQAALAFNALLFRRDSRPGTLGRELVAALALQDADAWKNVQTLLESTHNGPLVYWYAAEVFRFVNPALAVRLSETGLGRLDADRFVTDLRDFLGGDAFISGLPADLIVRLRALTAEERSALLSLAGDPARERRLAELIADESRPIEETVSRLLDELWETNIRNLVRARLRQIRGVGTIHAASHAPPRHGRGP